MGGKALNGKKITWAQAGTLFEKIIMDHDLSNRSQRIWLCGSWRRGKKTCGDLDIVFIDKDSTPHGSVKTWLVENFGTKKNGTPQTVCLIDGIQVEFYEAKPETWGSSVLMWTGSKWNNIKLRKAAKSRNLKLNQHGLFNEDNVNLAANKTEEEIFELLETKYVEPSRR
jgi:DNA polymerase (family X)